MNSSLVEVPTGTIINQFCSLDKWYAAPEFGETDDLISNSSYPGHRPAMMCKRDNGMYTEEDYESEEVWKNVFKDSTILGACKKINKLIMDITA